MVKIFGREIIEVDKQDLLASKLLGVDIFDSHKLGQSEIDALGRLMNSTLLEFAYKNCIKAFDFYPSTKGIDSLDGYGVNTGIKVFGILFYASTALVGVGLFVGQSVAAYIVVNTAHYITFGLVAGRSSEFLLPYYFARSLRYYMDAYKEQMSTSVNVKFDDANLSGLSKERVKNYKVEIAMDAIFNKVKSFDSVSADAALIEAMDLLLKIVKQDDDLKNRIDDKWIKGESEVKLDAVTLFKFIAEPLLNLEKKKDEIIQVNSKEPKDDVEFYGELNDMIAPDRKPYKKLYVRPLYSVINVICDDLKKDELLHKQLKEINQDFDFDSALNDVVSDVKNVKNGNASGKLDVNEARLVDVFGMMFQDGRRDKEIVEAVLRSVHQKEEFYVRKISPTARIERVISNLSEKNRRDYFIQSTRDEALRENGLVDTVRKNFGAITSSINYTLDLVFSKYGNTFVFDVAIFALKDFTAPHKVKSIFKLIIEELNRTNIDQDVKEELGIQANPFDIVTDILDKIEKDPKAFAIVVDELKAKSQMWTQRLLEKFTSFEDISKHLESINFDSDIAEVLDVVVSMVSKKLTKEQYVSNEIINHITRNQGAYIQKINAEIACNVVDSNIAANVVANVLKADAVLSAQIKVRNEDADVDAIFGRIIEQLQNRQIEGDIDLTGQDALQNIFEAMIEKDFVFSTEDALVLKATVEKIKLHQELNANVAERLVNEMKAEFALLNPQLSIQLNEGFFNAFIGFVQNLLQDNNVVHLILNKDEEGLMAKLPSIGLEILQNHKKKLNAVINSALMSFDFGNKALSGIIILVRHLVGKGTLVNIAQNLLTAFIKFQEFPQIVQNLKEKREIFNKYSRNTSLLDDTRVSKESLEYSAAEKEFLDAYNKFNTSLTDSIASVQQAIESLRSQGKLEEVEAIQDLLAKAMHYGLNYVEPQFKELVSNFQANGAIWKDRLSYLINLGNVANKGVGTIDEHAIKEYILQLDVTDALHFVVPFILPSAQLINIKDKSVASVTEALGEFANLGVLSHAPVQGTVGIVKALTSTISTPFYFLNDVAQNYIYQELHSLSQILRDASKQYNGQKRVNLNRILAKIKDADKVFKLGEYHSLEFKNCELKASNKWKGKVSILTSTVENFVFENAKIEALDMRNCSISNLKIVDSELINCDFADFDSSAFNYLEIRNSVEIHNSKFDMHSFAGLIDKVYGTPNEIKIDVSNISIANLTTSDKTKLRQILSVVPNIEAFIERNPSFKDLFKPELIAEDIATNVDKNNPKHRFLENALFDIISCYTKDEQLYFINPKLFGLICKRIEAPLTEAKQYSQKTLEQDLKERVSEVLVDIIQNKDQYLEDQSLKSELSIFDIIAPKTFLPAFNMFATKTQNLLDVLANAKKMYERSGKKEKVHLADLIFVDSSSSGFKADRYTVLNFTGCEFSQLHGGGDLDLDFIIVSGLQFKNSKMSNVNLSNSTIQYLKMIDSELSEFDFDSVSIRNIEIKNSTLDKQTFFGIMAAMQNHGMSAVSLQDITPSNDFIEYLKEPQNANELRNTLAHLRNFDAFLNDNPIFKEHLNNVYNKNDLLNEITQEINAFECDAILLDDRKTLLIAALKKVIETLNMEEIREFYRVQDKIMGAKAYAYGMVKGSGIINIMTSVHYIDRLWYGDYLNEFLIEDAVERIIEENVKCVQYSVERKKIAQNIISMIESHREELACVDFNALTKAITGAVEVVGDQYISLLNRAQDKVVGSLQYSYFSGYYHTGLLSIAHESSYMQHDHMLDKVKKIMAQEMGSNFIFDSDREIAEVTKS